jgi:long-chain acyl-CoA synthetase
MLISVVEGLEAAVRAAPGAPALATRDTVWTYRELASAIDAAQRAFSGRSARRGSRIALLMSNTPQYVALYYGIMAAGRVAVPLNTQERRRLLTQQIKHCGASLLCGDPAHPQWAGVSVDAAEFGVDVMQVPRLTGPDAPAMFIDSLRASARGEPYMQTGPDEPAAIFFTSGTTGRPKGVVLSHRNLASNAEAIARYLELSSSDRGFCVLPTHSSYGNSVLNSHLVRGARLAFEDSLAFPQIIVQRMQDESITGFAGVPSTFNVLRAQTCLQNFDLRSLRYVTQAGSAMPRALITWLREALPATRLFLMYGQTEATARLTYLPPERLNEKPGSVGIPIDGVEVQVLRAGRQAVAMEVGEIRVRGPTVMLGYWQDPETTAQVLRDGWLYTGDLGHRDSEGYLYIDGRMSDLIKTGAYRVSPDEIEEVIASLSGVREVGVTAIADALLGHAIKAVIVGDGTLDARRVQAHCREHLAGYKVPKIIEFAEALPRTASGKLQRSKLT